MTHKLTPRISHSMTGKGNVCFFKIFFYVLTSLKKKKLSGWGDCPSWGQPILREQRAQLRLVNPEPYLFYLAWVYPRRQDSSALIIPRPGTRQLGTTTIIYSWFKLLNQSYCLSCHAFPFPLKPQFRLWPNFSLAPVICLLSTWCLSHEVLCSM